MKGLERLIVTIFLAWQVAWTLWKQLPNYQLEPGEDLQLEYQLKIVPEEPETECGV